MSYFDFMDILGIIAFIGVIICLWHAILSIGE